MAVEALYRDATAAHEQRVADLLARMTLREKLAQLGSIWAFELMGPDGLVPDRMPGLLGHGLGELTRLAGSTNLRPAEVAAVGNEIQRFLVEETRLGIPTIIHEECLHGLLAWAAPCFQQAIGAAAAFDPELLERVADTIRRRMLATGARHGLAPVLDIAADPRWGRIEETYGEDPYLAAVLGVSYVRGLQGGDPRSGVIATGKHLVGHAASEGGLNQAPAHMGWRELRDEQLLPFEAAIREAGMGSVMPAYIDLDGVPCHASRELLTVILREEWDFDGLVASDYIGIEQIARQHRMTDDMAVAAAMALEAGVDLELPRSRAYGDPLARAVDRGLVDERLVDETVARVLLAKFRLGLFDAPLIEPPSDAMLASLATEERELGRTLARRSIVLLENDGTLPLATEGHRIAVIGPIADSARDLLGDYSHLVHIETLLEMQTRDNPLGFEAADEVTLADELAGRRTIVDAIRDRFGHASVTHARGSGLIERDETALAEAIGVARSADVAIVVAGERSGLTTDATTGEGRDRRELGLLAPQQDLLEAVVGTGTPTILVLISGRPLSVEWAARQCAAVLLAWVPGDDGPDAIADVIAGDENPGGKLPVTIPRHVGQVPLRYRHHPSGGRSNWKGDHVDGPEGPLWPFGFGRSYTTFAISGLRVDTTTVATDGGRLIASLEVANTGSRQGDEVVQLYFRDEAASVVRPVLELCGTRRVTLDAGEQRTVRFELAAEQFSYTGADYRRVVEPGTITLRAGTSSVDLPLSASVELVGDVVELRARHRFVTPSSVD